MTGLDRILTELGRFDGDLEIVQAWRDGLAPEPALLVSEWADRHRVLGSRGSAETAPPGAPAKRRSAASNSAGSSRPNTS
jgi:phage terminase large subunit GpA-like protein